jgi:hypothetical protein
LGVLDPAERLLPLDGVIVDRFVAFFCAHVFLQSAIAVSGAPAGPLA